MRRLLVLWLLIGLLAAVPAVDAHARPVTLTPGAGARLADPPVQVAIDFTEPINEQGTRIDVFNASGARMPASPARLDGERRAVIDVALPTDDQAYLVQWTTYSLLDGHRMAGSWGFAVGNATPPQTNSTVLSPLDFPSVFNKSLAYVGLVGLFALAWSASLFGGATDRVWRYGLLGSILLACGQVLQALSQMARDGPLTFLDNPYAQRLALQALTGTAMVVVVCLRKNARGVQTLMILLAFWAVTNGAGSHSRAALGDVGALLDAVHVLLATAWIGAVLLLWLDVEAPADLHGRRARYIGRIGLACVAGLVATGILLGLSQTIWSGRSPLGLPLSYGLVLLYKLGLIAVLLGFGAVNQYVHLPRLSQPGRRELLRANLRRELLVGLMVLALAAILATVDPELP